MANQLSAATGKDRLSLVPDISLQALGQGEGGVLLNLKSGEMFSINDTAFEFLARVDGKRTIDQIVGELLDLFEVDRETLAADVMEIAEELKKEKLLA